LFTFCLCLVFAAQGYAVPFVIHQLNVINLRHRFLKKHLQKQLITGYYHG